jgi:Zn-dependent M16 (insulinase) family peptidase
MEGPSSTMFKRLIESGLAPGYCHGYGYDTTLREGVMTIGVQNISNDYKKFKQIEDAIFEGLHEVAKNGFNSKLVEEVLHLIEYDSKKPRNDFAINFFNTSCGFITHSDYPFNILHVNEYAMRLKQELNQAPVFQTMVQNYLLQNNHRLKLILRPKDTLASELNKEEYDTLINTERNLTDELGEKIIQDTEKLIEHQGKIQDMNILPCLTVEDISREIEKVEHKKYKLAHDIDLWNFDQPTNGIGFIRLKINIKSIPKEFKDYIPLYMTILPKLGTKKTGYEEFQNKLHTNSPGLDIDVDAFCNKNNNDETYENLIFEFSFLDSNLDKALSLYEELFSTPDFFDHTNLNQIIKQESVNIANEITNNALDYSMSYASAGLRDYKKTYEKFSSDMSICRLGSELLRISSPKTVLDNVSEKLFLLHNMILRKDAITCSYHGSKKYIDSITSRLSLLLNSIKNENNIFIEELKSDDTSIFEEKYLKIVVRTPAAVSECVEVFKTPNYTHPDYPKCVIMSNLISLSILHKEIREKGGAYGSGAKNTESSLCTFFSYRDPKPDRSYEIFEKAIMAARDGKFNEQDIRDAKIFTFSKVDRIINPADKGLLYFLRNVTDEEKNQFRNRLLVVTAEDIKQVAENYFIKQLEEGTTSRVVFGKVELKDFEEINPLDFIGEEYFRERIEEDDKK